VNSLAELPGVGPRLAERLRKHFGTEEAALAALEQGDLTRLGEVPGLGTDRALTLARHTSGGASDFLATDEASEIHRRLLAQLAAHAGCTATRDRVRLLTPLSAARRADIARRQQRFAAAMDYATAHAGDFAGLRDACRGLAPPRPPTLKSRRVVVCATAAIHARLRPLAPHCRLRRRGEGESGRDYLGLSPLTWVGSGAPDNPPGDWLVLADDADAAPETALPELTPAWFAHNRRALEALVRLAGLAPSDHPFAHWLRSGLDGLTELPGALTALDSEEPALTRLRTVHDDLWKMLGDTEVWVNEEITRRVRERSVTLGGDHILEYLREPRGLRGHLDDEVGHLLDEVTGEGEARVNDFLAPAGLALPDGCFGATLPREVDRQAIQRLETDLATRLREAGDRATRDLAARLRPLRATCEAALRYALEAEVRLTVAAWARERRLVLPELADGGVALTGGRHLLLDGDIEPVDYGLGPAAPAGDRQRVALLSGANSGGKTTLLETLAQAVILAHCGLPVAANAARIGLVDRLHFLAKARGAQSAGALEQTLRSLARVVTSPASKVLLADELEAITEPGAGARILAALLEAAAANPATMMVLVTHIAPQIRDACAAELRIDGIEARGLDAQLELIVDRTPRRNHLARSTPELIVRRLVERAEGAERELFARVLGKFGD